MAPKVRKAAFHPVEEVRPPKPVVVDKVAVATEDDEPLDIEDMDGEEEDLDAAEIEDDLIEDASDLGEDTDDMAEVMEHIDEEVEDKV